jgi:hypothetical protein
MEKARDGSNSSTRDQEMTETRQARRPNRALPGRIKLVAVIFSVVAFIGSLAGVAIANPATANRATQVVQPAPRRQNPDLPALSSDGSLVMPSRPQLLRVRPMTRTRGS